MPDTIRRLEEGTRGERRGKRKEKEQGKKCFAEMAVMFSFQSVLCETEVGWPTVGHAGTSGQAQVTTHPTSTSPRMPQGGPGRSAEPLPPLLLVRHSCSLRTKKKKKKKEESEHIRDDYKNVYKTHLGDVSTSPYALLYSIVPPLQ